MRRDIETGFFLFERELLQRFKLRHIGQLHTLPRRALHVKKAALPRQLTLSFRRRTFYQLFINRHELRSVRSGIVKTTRKYQRFYLGFVYIRHRSAYAVLQIYKISIFPLFYQSVYRAADLPQSRQPEPYPAVFYRKLGPGFIHIRRQELYAAAFYIPHIVRQLVRI